VSTEINKDYLNSNYMVLFLIPGYQSQLYRIV